MKMTTVVFDKHCLAFVAAAVAVPSFAFTRIDPVPTPTEGIEGLPVVSDRLKAAHWETRITTDGKSLELVYVNGLAVFLR